ncbi:acyl--CoA ligase [Allokutzneria sp. A3M-2-11 16]|uniref:class I adenylate-forming enzyme family protein n=1 Tax=Allokutzneria sp. A3M-2-11 16 TaxID=2962043 RepID=UPI0020B881B6|nr:class I adenylate-forming enzyme family protein [Allokutzneria sp. A3M-2-11 16]MCP3799392.1 acyl--CoA ligase [Allokutzneria sp. A3M-2-11 16]
MITKAERAQIVADDELGAGNVLHRLAVYGRPEHEEVLWTDGTWRAPDGSHPEVLTLGGLRATVETYAGFYHSRGVRPRDVVAVVTASSPEFAINFLALTALGAIPSFANAKLRPEIVREYVRRQAALGVITDEDRFPVLSGAGDPDPGVEFVVTAADVRPEHRELLPAGYPYRHHATDPIIISHSSGTTGMPKAVPHTHQSLLYAHLHALRVFMGDGMTRLLVNYPGNHNAAMSTMMLGLLLRAPVMMLSSQVGTDVLDAIEQFKPSAVFAFSGTYAQMAAEDLSARNMSSIERYFNTGDAAHEAHIRKLITQGSHEEIGPDFQRHRVPGSVFTDGLGSSETGYSMFNNAHRPGSASFGRCIGKAMSFADAAVLSEDGRPLPAGEVGRLGVRSPTLTPGYWNDSGTWHKLRLGGYWLTGDLAYRDEKGYFFHLDRAPDAVRTAAGIVFSTRSEELLLRELPGLADCTVVGIAPDGVRADWDGDGEAEAYALLQLAEDARTPDDLTAWVNEVLVAEGFPPMAKALRMDMGELAVGVTGKVLKRVMRERARELVARAENQVAVGRED